MVVGLLGLILVVLVSLIVVSLAMVQKSRLRARATAIAEEGIERIKAKRGEEEYINDWDEFKSICGGDAQDWAYGSDTIPTAYPTVQAECEEVGDDVKVTTTVGWQFGGEWYDVVVDTEFGPREKGIFR